MLDFQINLSVRIYVLTCVSLDYFSKWPKLAHCASPSQVNARTLIQILKAKKMVLLIKKCILGHDKTFSIHKYIF